MKGLKSEASTFSARDRRFKFEYKYFQFKIDNGGSTATIVEQTRNQHFSVSIDFGGCFG